MSCSHDPPKRSSCGPGWWRLGDIRAVIHVDIKFAGTWHPACPGGHCSCTYEESLWGPIRSCSDHLLIVGAVVPGFVTQRGIHPGPHELRFGRWWLQLLRPRSSGKTCMRHCAHYLQMLGAVSTERLELLGVIFRGVEFRISHYNHCSDIWGHV